MRLSRILAVTLVAVSAMTVSANAAIVVSLYVNPFTASGDPLSAVTPGDMITYQIAVGVVNDGSNKGLATMVYDVKSPEATAGGYWLTELLPAESGYAQLGASGIGAMRDVTSSMYVDSGSSLYPGYNGGWGFDNAGLPTGGSITAAGQIVAAGSLAPLTWDADVTPLYPGLQPYARLGVGHGTYMFPADDPAVGGLMGGFGQDISNLNNVREGDGKWLFMYGEIDTTGWGAGEYNFTIDGTTAAVFSPTLDYSQDWGGGFRMAVENDSIADASFSFTLIPEPTTIGLMALGTLGLFARRRR